jgi:hypothetical protein
MHGFEASRTEPPADALPDLQPADITVQGASWGLVFAAHRLIDRVPMTRNLAPLSVPPLPAVHGLDIAQAPLDRLEGSPIAADLTSDGLEISQL